MPHRWWSLGFGPSCRSRGTSARSSLSIRDPEEATGSKRPQILQEHVQANEAITSIHGLEDIWRRNLGTLESGW